MSRTPDDAFLSHLRGAAFGLGRRTRGPARIGAEVELIPVDAVTRRVAPIMSGDAPSTLEALRYAGRHRGWHEAVSPKSGLPEFCTSSGGRITFEPGGQVEYASTPAGSVSELLVDLLDVTSAIHEGLAEHGLEAVHAGIDPVNAIDDVPLQVGAERYRRMDAHFASIGPHGARMMRQTASIQVNVDLGDEPLVRWELLNAIAPYLGAMFANAPTHAGSPSPDASARRRAWQELDPGRTGLPYDRRCPVEGYFAFAMGAASILGPVDEPPFPTFAALASGGRADLPAWEAHLSTLFPEVRPRGWFEVRSMDAVDPAWYAAPLVMVAGLALAPAVAREARGVAGPPDASLLERAARDGLADSRLAVVAADLARLALVGAESLGPSVSPGDLDRARAFFRRYTWAGRTPADDQPASVA